MPSWWGPPHSSSESPDPDVAWASPNRRLGSGCWARNLLLGMLGEAAMGTATRLSPTPAPPAPSRGDAGVRARAASQNSACLHQSLAGSKEGAFYFSRQEPSRAFADARLEEGMLILFRTLRQPVFPSMPEIPWAFHSRALARCPRGAAGFGANSRTIRRAGIVGGIGGGLVGVAALSTRTGYGCPERVRLQ